MPRRAPNRMVGKKEIGDFLRRVKGSNVRLSIGDEVVGKQRAAFCLWFELSSGKRIIENIIIHIANGKITRQVDVEAWD